MQFLRFQKDWSEKRFKEGSDDSCFLGGWLSKGKKQDPSGRSPNVRGGSAHQSSDQHENCHDRVKNRVTLMQVINEMEENITNYSGHISLKKTHEKHDMCEKQNDSPNAAATQDGKGINMHVRVGELHSTEKKGYRVTLGDSGSQDRNFRRTPGNHVISI